MNEGQVLTVFMCWGWIDWFELEECGLVDVEAGEGECSFNCSKFPLDAAIKFSQIEWRTLWCWSRRLGFEVCLHFCWGAGASFGRFAVASCGLSVSLSCWCCRVGWGVF